MLSVKAVSKITGISPFTIRAWELRYQAVSPRRTATGRRIYSEQDVRRLKRLHELVLRGAAISQVAGLSDQELESAAISSQGPVSKARRGLLERTQDALLAFDLEGVERLLRQARLELTVTAYLLEYVSPLFQWVGTQSFAGAISISQEHAFSALARHQLGEILYSIPRPDRGATVVALATPPGELHEFGILIAGILCGLQGFEVHLFGASLPAEPFALAAGAVGAKLVLVGTSSNGEGDSSYLRVLSKHLRKGTRVWVGGALAYTMTRGAKRGFEAIPDFQALQERLRKL